MSKTENGKKVNKFPILSSKLTFQNGMRFLRNCQAGFIDVCWMSLGEKNVTNLH